VNRMSFTSVSAGMGNIVCIGGRVREHTGLCVQVCSFHWPVRSGKVRESNGILLVVQLHDCIAVIVVYLRESTVNCFVHISKSFLTAPPSSSMAIIEYQVFCYTFMT